MSTLLADPLAPAAKRTVLVAPDSKQKPRTVDLLNDWQYIEKSIHRLIAAWGKDVAGWNDKSTIHRHVWDQAECVRRLRERVEQFPGGKADAPGLQSPGATRQRRLARALHQRCARRHLRTDAEDLGRRLR
jgi:hypothetical protein